MLIAKRLRKTTFETSYYCKIKKNWKMARHEKCNLFVDNFVFEYLGMDCPTCAALGEAHLCGSHPQRIQPAGCERANFTYLY